MAKKTSKTDYVLKRRFVNKFNKMTEWQDIGHGQFQDLKTVQNQIKMLARSRKGRGIEIHFEKDGKLLDYSGKEIKTTIKINKE